MSPEEEQIFRRLWMPWTPEKSEIPRLPLSSATMPEPTLWSGQKITGLRLVVIPEIMIAKYRNRIINIHPSLIPSFCGKGYYGLKVHEGVLARGVKVTGATVHFVDEGTDTGPIILQKAVSVRQDDTPKTLQRRVMEEAEWKILPRAIDLIAEGRVSVVDNRVMIEGED